MFFRWTTEAECFDTDSEDQNPQMGEQSANANSQENREEIGRRQERIGKTTGSGSEKKRLQGHYKSKGPLKPH
jgi:hypothetical protein